MRLSDFAPKLGALAVIVACSGGAAPAAAQQAPSSWDQLAKTSLAKIDGTLRVPGLKANVEVLRDQWGVPHIYAQNLDDLFFAQGYVQAQDRLWQMDLWHRIGDGTVSEIVGSSAVERDRMARLLMYRGPWDDSEWNNYHPEGKRIFEAFARGVNAFIETNRNNLPVEFKLTGVQPKPWTARTSLLRRASIGGAGGELRLAAQVAELGLEEMNRRLKPTPYRVLKLPNGVDLKKITPAVIAAGGGGGFGGGGGGGLPKPALLPEYSTWVGAFDSPHGGAIENSPGSNNWVVSGRKTTTGKVILAGDPHRQVTNPSLRYLVHLNAPGWHATGATEPATPGVLIGHNDSIGWALTIVGTDQSDVFVNEVNPANRNQIRWKGQWEDLKIVTDTIRVKGGAPVIVQLKYSRHGPIFYEDTENNLNYAYRSVDNEPGSAGYLGALRLNQTGNCRDFLDEVLKHYKAPTENMICGDVHGNIGWIAAAASPKRVGANWDGRLPVSGTGEYEWAGFRMDLPRELNPERGFIATANHDIHPAGYDPPLFFKNGTFPRFERLTQILSQDRKFSVEDFKKLQHDTYWAAAEEDQALLRGWTGRTPELERARAMVESWNRHNDREIVAPSVYSVWNRRLDAHKVQPSMPKAARDSLAQVALQEALDTLTAVHKVPWDQVNWGKINRSEFPHPLVKAYDIPAVQRRGGAGTVAAIGATVRQIFDYADFDRSVQMNTPGQSAQPGSPFYSNLAVSMGNAEYFPQMYTRPAVEGVTKYRLTLQPAP
jgi:penicillin amidase